MLSWISVFVLVFTHRRSRLESTQFGPRKNKKNWAIYYEFIFSNKIFQLFLLLYILELDKGLFSVLDKKHVA